MGKSCGDEATLPDPVALALASGEGLLLLEGLGLWFALLICGENNVFRYGPGPSVFRGKPGSAKVPAPFEGRWLLLNPAHEPYRGGSRGGLTKIEQVAEKGPMLGNLVRDARRYTDGTRAPAAVIHANNFRDEATKRRASIVFWGRRRRLPKEEHGDHQVRVITRDLPLEALKR